MLREKLEVVANEPIGSSTLFEVKDHMLDVVEQHIERRLQSRRLLEESLEPLH